MGILNTYCFLAVPEVTLASYTIAHFLKQTGTNKPVLASLHVINTGSIPTPPFSSPLIFTSFKRDFSGQSSALSLCRHPLGFSVQPDSEQEQCLDDTSWGTVAVQQEEGVGQPHKSSAGLTAAASSRLK